MQAERGSVPELLVDIGAWSSVAGMGDVVRGQTELFDARAFGIVLSGMRADSAVRIR
jgi:hypothetical protein